MVFLKKCKSMNNEYLIAMRPMLYLLKIICALPFIIKPKYEIPCFISSKMVSSLAVVMCIVFHNEFGGYIINILIRNNITNIIIIVGKCPEILFELFCLSVPLLMLNRHTEMQEYWDAWRHFQSRYEAISGTTFVSRKRRHIKILSLLCILWILSRNFYAAWFHYHIFNGIMDYLANVYLLFLLYIISTYWFSNCAYIWSVSEDVIKLGKIIIAEKKDSSKLNKLISLWLNLSDLTSHFNEAHSFIFLAFFLLAAISTITYAYALLHYSTYKNIYPITVWINLLMIFVVFLLIMCETAYLVHHRMTHLQKEALLQENMTKVEAMTLRSVSRFLHIITLRNPTIHLNGFFSLNRILFPTIFSLCINYLIVLRQFSDMPPVN